MAMFAEMPTGGGQRKAHMPTDAPDAVQQLIASLPHTSTGGDFFVPPSHDATTCIRCQLAHLHQTVLLPAIEALDDAQEYICDQTGSPHTHESLMAKINAARKAWDAPAGGEGTAK